MAELRQRGGAGTSKESSCNATTTTPSSSSSSMKKPRVVIVGGGPAGAAVAKSLADSQLYDVNLYEAYPHPHTEKKQSSKAYVIALSGRGQRGIQESTNMKGQPASIISKSVLSPVMVRHPKNRSIRHDDKPSLIVPRQDLTAHLLDQAAAAGALIHYQQRFVELNAKERIVVFEESTKEAATTSSKQQQRVSYDLLIAADGCNSRIRQQLDQQADDFSVVRTEQDSMEYQVATVVPTDDGDGDGTVFPHLPATAVHAWNNPKYNAICLAFPLHKDNGGGMLFAIVFPEGKLQEFQEQHQKKTGDGYKDALGSLLPDIPVKVKDSIIEQLAVGKPANGGVCVWTSALGSAEHGVVLVGDSGHGMWPSLGQGANCALESAAVFCQSIHRARDLLLLGNNNENNDTATTSDDWRDGWSKVVVEEFNTRRYADAVAAVDLTYGGIGARKSRGRANAPLSFKLQVATVMLLNLVTGGFVPKPALLRIMGGDDISYEKARKYNFYYEKIICWSTLAVLVAVPTFLRYKS